METIFTFSMSPVIIIFSNSKTFFKSSLTEKFIEDVFKKYMRVI